MPTYVYRCQQCGTTIERRQRFQDAPLTACESCQGELRRVIQPVGIIFKGSGFYTTDYKAGESKLNGAAESSPTTESAPAATESTKPSDPAPAPSTADKPS